MNEILQTILLFFSAIGATVAAITGIVAFYRRHALPTILVNVSESSLQSPELVAGHRQVVFRQTDRPTKWLVREIGIAGCGRKRWLSVTGDPIRDPLGGIAGYRQSNDWRRVIVFDPPIDGGVVLLHPDAPSPNRFLLSVVMRSAPRVRRKVSAYAGGYY